MPAVFVHGVGVRTGPAYWADIEVRKRLIRDFLFEPLNLPPTTTVEFAYWGGHGARFRWGHASFPSRGDEALGPQGESGLVELLGEYADLGPTSADGFVAEVARSRSIGDALDLIVAAAAEGAGSQQAADLVEVAKATLGSYRASDRPDWLSAIDSDRDFIAALADRVKGPDADEETFGSTSRGWVRLREQLSRIRTAVPAATGRLAGSLARPRIHDQAATFFGDILVYLERAGAEGGQADIINAVAATIDAAARARSGQDPLVVIAHSMGGNIMYDLLSYYRTDLAVDTLVTVGSQVGLFQELDLFAAKYPELQPPRDRVPIPSNIGRWINVYDRNDVLGFSVGRVFDGAVDYEYGTGLGLFKAHSSYFIRPSFYQRLAARLR